VNRGFRDDIGVEAVAKIDRINVVTVCHARLARVPCYAHLSPFFGALRSSIVMRQDFGIPPVRRSEQRKRHSPFQIAIHDREENLQEQVDGID
jgi:hypothetical protein